MTRQIHLAIGARRPEFTDYDREWFFAAGGKNSSHPAVGEVFQGQGKAFAGNIDLQYGHFDLLIRLTTILVSLTNLFASWLI